MELFLLVRQSGLPYRDVISEACGKILHRPAEMREVILGKSVIDALLEAVPSMDVDKELRSLAGECCAIIHIHASHWEDLLEQINSWEADQRESKGGDTIYRPHPDDAAVAAKFFNDLLMEAGPSQTH